MLRHLRSQRSMFGPVASEATVWRHSPRWSSLSPADKQDARPNYERGYGYHPLLAMIAETDEVLTAKLSPGNAGSNTAVDHVTVLVDALAQLPAAWRVGHGVGDDPSEVAHRVLIRADAGAASHWF